MEDVFKSMNLPRFVNDTIDTQLGMVQFPSFAGLALHVLEPCSFILNLGWIAIFVRV